MNRSGALWLGVAAVAVLGSAIGVVYTKALSRTLFVELQKARAQHEEANMEWGRLQLELASTGSLEEVMRAAAESLHMHAPRPENVVVVE
ncbi:MAG: cell division protein FtsL [Gammaproteobacteria bacterium]|nr:MAG: cell division protein FtsL [Gammaproteobacteria bacterium]